MNREWTGEEIFRVVLCYVGVCVVWCVRVPIELQVDVTGTKGKEKKTSIFGLQQAVASCGRKEVFSY